MSIQAAFQRGVTPLLQILLPGKENAVLSIQPDPALTRRIEHLASLSTEGSLTPEEAEEYEGYVKANKFVAILRRQARNLSRQLAK
ncbi:hypothetical protein WJU23_05530 [Prosthecobacter sp. SYSU 5D2]|uniref:hypothetical protein n=1 Tax=Prosthecobacter sp. SYSU 5D2 TaxID=3134134 RepID=UPI0031FF238B